MQAQLLKAVEKKHFFRKRKSNRATIYEIVTNRIIALLKKGVIPWRNPFAIKAPVNLVSMKEYQGINRLLLMNAGFKSPYFLTYRQSIELGGYVKKGSKGLPVIYWEIKDNEDKDSEEEEIILMHHTVFNLEQTENVVAPGKMNKLRLAPVKECEKVIQEMPKKPSIVFNNNAKPCYSSEHDEITMPDMQEFCGIEHYYAILFHEMTHATGHITRLNRKSLIQHGGYGTAEYSKEELVAEIGASYLCDLTGIGDETIINQARYISSWLKRFENDKRLIILAASQAQKAADFILNRKQEKKK